MNLKSKFEIALCKEAEKRNQRETQEWIEAELSLMLRMTNDERARRRLAPVSRGDILRVETMALGHVDYASKFALYCSELAQGLTPTP